MHVTRTHKGKGSCRAPHSVCAARAVALWLVQRKVYTTMWGECVTSKGPRENPHLSTLKAIDLALAVKMPESL